MPGLNWYKAVLGKTYLVPSPSGGPAMSILSGFQNLTISGSTVNVVSGNQTNARNVVADSALANHQATTTVAPSACINTVPMVPGKMTLPRLSDMFTGREDILQQLAQYLDPTKTSVTLKKQRIFVLHGLGGAGKTQIMAKFVDEFGDQYDDHFIAAKGFAEVYDCGPRFIGVYYIDATTLETIKASLEDIARTVSAGNTVDDALRWFAQERKDWLLIIDNADDPEINLRPFLPRCRHGNVIITTRNPDCRLYAPNSNCNVSGMKHDDAIELLLKLAMVEDSARNRSLAGSICEELGYFALAIVQAGAFIQQSCAISEYLQIYHEDRIKLLQKHSVQAVDDYQWTVYTTWEISLKKLTPTAAAFLRVCSFMHHDGISKAIFQCAATAGDLRDAFRDGNDFLSNFKSENGEWSNIKFLEFIKELGSYSLISIDTENQVYSIHPLVHMWARYRASPAEQSEAQNCVLQILALAVNDDYSAESFAFRRSLLPHIDESRTDTMNYDIADKLQKVYFQVQRLKAAEELQKLVMEARRKLLGDVHLDTLKIMGDLAYTYWHQDRLKEAEEIGLQVMEARRRLLGVEHPDTLRSMTSLACIYGTQGRLKEAEELELQAMVVRRRLLGIGHPATLISMAGLACTYGRQGRWKEAENIQLQVMEQTKRLLGVDHQDTVLSMTNLSWIYSNQNRFKEAEELELQAMEVRRRLLGINHPDTLRSMTNLAWINEKQDRLKEAEELGQQVMEVRRRRLGIEHSDTLNSMANLACTYMKQGRWKEAENLQLKVMEPMKRLLGVDHQDTILSMANLALIYRKQNRLKEVEELLLQVMETRSRVLGIDHPDTLESMTNLAHTYSDQGQMKEAEELELQVMEARRRLLGVEHPDTLWSMGILSWIYGEQGRWKEADELCQQMIEARKRLLGIEHPDTLWSMGQLAWIYENQGRFKEAEELWLQVEEARKEDS